MKDWEDLSISQRELAVKRLQERFERIFAAVESSEQLVEIRNGQTDPKKLAKETNKLVMEAEAIAAAIVRLGWRATMAKHALDRMQLSVRIIGSGGSKTKRRKR